MSDEVKVVEEKECKCFCKSEGFRKFLTIALGTFVGVYAALSLFAATHRPPMVPPCAMKFGHHSQYATGCPFKHHKNFDKGFKDIEHFHKDMKKHSEQAPFESKREIDD